VWRDRGVQAGDRFNGPDAPASSSDRRSAESGTRCPILPGGRHRGRSDRPHDHAGCAGRRRSPPSSSDPGPPAGRRRRGSVAVGGDLPLGRHHAVVVHRRRQLDRRGGLGPRTAHYLGVERSPTAPAPPSSPAQPGVMFRPAETRRSRRSAHQRAHAAAGGAPLRRAAPIADRCVDRRRSRGTQRVLRDIPDPLADRDERAGPGQHRRGCRAQQRDHRIPRSPHIAGIGDQDQETPQVSDVV
jgi:hypothetical protein